MSESVTAIAVAFVVGVATGLYATEFTGTRNEKSHASNQEPSASSPPPVVASNVIPAECSEELGVGDAKPASLNCVDKVVSKSAKQESVDESKIASAKPEAAPKAPKKKAAAKTSGSKRSNPSPPDATIETKKRRKPRKKKDPLHPKLNASSYCHYVRARREQMGSEAKALSFGEFGKQMGVEWRLLDQEAKQRYEEAANRDRERYVREKKIYDTQQKADEYAAQNAQLAS